MGTLLAQTFPAFSQMAPQEASFLGTLLPDLLRAARKTGTARLAFHEYVLHAHSESLGAVLVAVSWSIRRDGVKATDPESEERRTEGAKMPLSPING
jgi:hypothetical protein